MPFILNFFWSICFLLYIVLLLLDESEMPLFCLARHILFLMKFVSPCDWAFFSSIFVSWRGKIVEAKTQAA